VSDLVSHSLGRGGLFLYGGFGAAIQDILLFFSKRFSAPALEFNVVQYALVLIVYCAAAGLVATIYPYRQPQTAWKAFVVGLLLPSIIGGLIAASQRFEGRGFDVTVRGPVPVVTPNQAEPARIEGNLADLLALF
jgi:hypothetical protein